MDCLCVFRYMCSDRFGDSAQYIIRQMDTDTIAEVSQIRDVSKPRLRHDLFSLYFGPILKRLCIRCTVSNACMYTYPTKVMHPGCHFSFEVAQFALALCSFSTL